MSRTERLAGRRRLGGDRACAARKLDRDLRQGHGSFEPTPDAARRAGIPGGVRDVTGRSGSSRGPRYVTPQT